MQLLETFFIGISLAMDAFAVAICKGLAMKQMSWKKAMLIGLYFGFFQMLMPIFMKRQIRINMLNCRQVWTMSQAHLRR